MKIIYLTTLFSIFAILHTQAQNDSLQVTDLWVANIVSPGITYEKAIGKRSTVSATVGLNFSGYIQASSNSETVAEYSLNPSAGISYRYYYNFKKRQERGKNIKHNSANYISLSSYYYWAPVSTSFPKHLAENTYHFAIGPVWGFQRTYKKRLHLNLDLGLGYVDSKIIETTSITLNSSTHTSYALKDNSGIGLISNFRLGIYLGKM